MRGEDMLTRMRSRTSCFVALCALAICLSSQAAEMFDRWDHTVQTGNDTEYTFVVLALCVGVSYTLRWFVPEINAPNTVIFGVSEPRFDSSPRPSIQSASILFGTWSPPSLPLRI